MNERVSIVSSHVDVARKQIKYVATSLEFPCLLSGPEGVQL